MIISYQSLSALAPAKRTCRHFRHHDRFHLNTSLYQSPLRRNWGRCRRTLMIVLPLIRPVGLRAATASSRVATLPMFVRTRPSRARRTISLSWSRSGTTTKSTVRPSAGRASVGPVMVTSVPPVRIRRADRFAMSPPRTSNTSRPRRHLPGRRSRDRRTPAREVESRLTAGGAPGADDVRAGVTCELGCHRSDDAGRTVHQDALPRPKAAVLEQPLPRSQARHHEGRALLEVNVARQRREVACLDGYILRQRAVANPVREAEHPLSHRQPRRSVAEGGDHSGQLVAGDRRRPVTAETIDPGRGPRQLIPGESRRMNLNNDVAVVRAERLPSAAPCGSGRSTSFIPAVPAAWSVTTIAFIRHLPRCLRSRSIVVQRRTLFPRACSNGASSALGVEDGSRY